MFLVHKLVLDLNHCSWGSNMALKLDMAKVYDQMSFSFIIQMLQYFGFQGSGCFRFGELSMALGS